MTTSCWPWSHDYGKWEDYKFYTVRRAPTADEFIYAKRSGMVEEGHVLVQFKTCGKCGKKKSREIKA